MSMEWRPSKSHRPYGVVCGNIHGGALVWRPLGQYTYKAKVYHGGEVLGWRDNFLDRHRGQIWCADALRVLTEEGEEAARAFMGGGDGN